MPFRCLFHVHTRHSFDSLLAPETILDRARAMNVDVLIVTDHETMNGARDVRAGCNGNPRFAVMAAEYKTEKGDIIGLFLKQDIRTRNSGEVMAEIHAQGGLVVLPHPYKAHKLDDELLEHVDLIEVHNSRCSEAENRSACELSQKLNLPSLGGADAHCAGELAAVLNEFSPELPADEPGLRHCLLTSGREIKTQRVSAIFRPYSQVIKSIKTRDPLLFLSQMKRLGASVLRESLDRRRQVGP